jgi:hypothetical protein
MPAVLRAGMDSPEFSPSSVLRDIFSDLVNGLVKHAWARKFGEQKPVRSPRGIAKAIVQNVLYPDAARPEKKRRGKLVNSLNPHALWIRSLGWYGEIEGLNQSLESIYPDVREWRSRYEWFEHAPFKLSVKLSGGEENSHWRLDYFLRYLNSGDVIPAGNVWRGVMPVPRETGDYMRRYLLLMLGRVGALFAPVRESLELAAPGGCVLSTEDVSGFLLNHAPEMAGMGVELAYPDWWEKNSSDMLTIRGAPGVNDSSYKWELAWRGAILSGDERLAVAGGGLPLVWIRGGWVFISPDRLSAVLRHMEKLPDSLSRVEVIRLAIRDPLIDGFEGLPELEAEYSALRRGVPPEMIESPAGANVNLRSYQQRGFSWLAFLSGLGIGACLADDMGLGKTVQTLALVQRCRNLGQNRPVLLICPTSVIENWRIEIERFFPRMSFYVHHGRDRLRGRAFSGAAKRSAMVLSSYALLHRDFECYKGVDWLGLVLDEAQNIKNPDAQQSRAARGMKSDWRIVLTGTPIENHVGDIWSIMEFLMPGMLGSRRYFANTYIKPLKEAPDARVTEGLRRSISPFIMRRLKTDKDIVPDLPKKIEMKVYCGLKKEQFKLYAGVTNEMSRDIGRAAGIRRRGLVLAGLTRIKQICDHPSLALKDCDFGCHRSSKLERLMALAEEMFEAGDRALIFTQYVEMGHILKYQLQERFGRETLFLHGAVFKDARDRMVRNFQEGTGPQFFVLSLKAGGVGLNLTRANHVVMFDRWWNPAVENQATDRAFRIGQQKNVMVHKFITLGTIEEKIDALLADKQKMADDVIAQSGETWITEMSNEELMSLFALEGKR